jgi:hypothetical protein
MTDNVDLGPFDLVCTAQAKVEWLSDEDDLDKLAMREMFQAHLDKLARQFQVIMAHKIKTALTQSHRCVEDSSFGALHKGAKDGIPDL